MRASCHAVIIWYIDNVSMHANIFLKFVLPTVHPLIKGMTSDTSVYQRNLQARSS